MDIISDIKYQFRHGNTLMKLLLVNVLVFVIQSILLLFFYIGGQRDEYVIFLSRWLWLNDDLSILITRPWTIFTHMFMHDPSSVFHLLSNMLYLYFFGRIFADFIQPKNAMPLYLLGGLVGAFVSIAVTNLIPAYHEMVGIPMVGASAAVMAIVLATATVAPNYSVFVIFIGPVKIKYLALLVIIIDLVSIPSEYNLSGHVAHLGGALTGYLYIRSYQKNNNWFHWWPKFEGRVAGLFERKKPKIVYVNQTLRNQKPSSPSEAGKVEKQKKLDAILDKIKAGGYDSLSKAEKDFLFKISNEK
ncbi:MAG: rhomboid family intramembrane serine protease [Chitinophagales bacterium]